ncbi:MAG TPA: NUDIX hydrolase [Stellaceae bacterium]|nr:NUDIX hydrolase [Stellaceae bacterium]
MTTEPPRSAEPTTADLDARRAARRYPDRPIVAVLAVVLRGEGAETRALIVQRAQQPNAGRWGFPGGVLELGETVANGAMRELFEETGIVAKPAGVLDVHDAITRDGEGRVQFHYLLIAVRGIWQAGEGEPADDAAACAWVTRADIEAGRYPTFPTLLPLLDRGMNAADGASTSMPPQGRDGGGAAG